MWNPSSTYTNPIAKTTRMIKRILNTNLNTYSSGLMLTKEIMIWIMAKKSMNAKDIKK